MKPAIAACLARLGVLLALMLGAGAAQADPPRVDTDIAPVHSLVARVMQGVGMPDLILPPGASPHAYSMRPSEAAALQDADVVIWIGAALTPWLDRPLHALAGDALSLELLETEGVVLRDIRWGGHDGHSDHEGDGHGSIDPHVWFDPVNAELWLDVIAEALATRDPDNAALYRANAAAGAAEIAALTGEVTDILASMREVPLVHYHDSLAYFEARFGLTALGAMTEGDSAPSPRRLTDLRDVVAGRPVCVVLEPQVAQGLADAVLNGAGLGTIVRIDSQGAALKTGPGYYPALIRAIAEGLAGCSQVTKE